MPEPTFVAWVQPIARRFASTRAEVAQVAGRVPDGAWHHASPAEGWTYRDVLAHLAEGDAGLLQFALTAVFEGADTDFRPRNAKRDERIAKSLVRGQEVSVEDLIARSLREGEETQRLLAQLRSGDAETLLITSRSNPTPMTLREFLTAYHHDEEHLDQLRPALERAEVAR